MTLLKIEKKLKIFTISYVLYVFLALILLCPFPIPSAFCPCQPHHRETRRVPMSLVDSDRQNPSYPKGLSRS